MPSPESAPVPEQYVLSILDITQRAANASEKVKTRVTEKIIPAVRRMGEYAEGWLCKTLRPQFSDLIKNPGYRHANVDGDYTSWTPAEIKELYSVLYGKELTVEP